MFRFLVCDAGISVMKITFYLDVLVALRDLHKKFINSCADKTFVRVAELVAALIAIRGLLSVKSILGLWC